MSDDQKTHSFDIAVAAKVGTTAATIYQNLKFWINTNDKKGHNIREGKAWVYYSAAELAKEMPYLTEKQIRTAISRLVKAELIRTGNFNKHANDRTTWFCLTVSSDQNVRRSDISVTPSDKLATPSAQKVTPLPDSNPNINPYSNPVEKTEPRMDDNPLSKPRLKSNVSDLCLEAMDTFNSQILKRKAQPDYTMWPAWVALAGEEQAVFETVMGIIHASKIPDGPRVPFALDGVFRDPARTAYWRAQYNPPVTITAAPLIDFEAETIRELETMTDTERITRFEWYAQNFIKPPEEAVKRWKHLMPNEQNMQQISGGQQSRHSPQSSVA